MYPEIVNKMQVFVRLSSKSSSISSSKYISLALYAMADDLWRVFLYRWSTEHEIFTFIRCYLRRFWSWIRLELRLYALFGRIVEVKASIWLNGSPYCQPVPLRRIHDGPNHEYGKTLSFFLLASFIRYKLYKAGGEHFEQTKHVQTSRYCFWRKLSLLSLECKSLKPKTSTRI